MFRMGVDVGSTFTKYCVLEGKKIVALNTERTPLRQKEFFENKISELRQQYPNSEIISCGYGKKNVLNQKNINELTALARGSYFLTGEDEVILDIGGQDTKLIRQQGGKLTNFFINDKCAAGCGMFLSSILDRVELDFHEIDLRGVIRPAVQISTVCAVFAQSEIVEMIADNRTEQEIIQAVIWQILIKARILLNKTDRKGRSILLSGGLTLIPGIQEYASNALETECGVIENASYLSAIGCAVI